MMITDQASESIDLFWPTLTARRPRPLTMAGIFAALRAFFHLLLAQFDTLSPKARPPKPRPAKPLPLKPLPDDPVIVETIYWDNDRSRIDYLDDSPSLAAGIDETTEFAWEDDNATLAKSLFLIRYPSGRIAATGIYQPGTSKRYRGRPDLLWVLANGATVKLPCHYGIEEGGQ